MKDSSIIIAAIVLLGISLYFHFQPEPEACPDQQLVGRIYNPCLTAGYRR